MWGLFEDVQNEGFVAATSLAAHFIRIEYSTNDIAQQVDGYFLVLLVFESDGPKHLLAGDATAFAAGGGFSFFHQ